MEEIEVPVEQAQEEIHHHAEHSGERWIGQVALSSAVFAVLAAIAALLAGHHSNEAVIEEIRAAQQWNYFQSKGIKADVLDSRIDMLGIVGKPVTDADRERQVKLKKDKDEIQEKARELEASADEHLRVHHSLAQSVTFFQVTIAIGAIAALTRHRRYWFVSLATGVVGIGFLVKGLFFVH
jgi:pyruvate/2-oxoglutarate dehydrogenase complex dihydrolipoamide acyltransferase (E2) component